MRSQLVRILKVHWFRDCTNSFFCHKLCDCWHGYFRQRSKDSGTKTQRQRQCQHNDKRSNPCPWGKCIAFHIPGKRDRVVRGFLRDEQDRYFLKGVQQNTDRGRVLAWQLQHDLCRGEGLGRHPAHGNVRQRHWLHPSGRQRLDHCRKPRHLVHRHGRVAAVSLRAKSSGRNRSSWLRWTRWGTPAIHQWCSGTGCHG